MLAGGRSPAVQMRAEGEIGVTPPLGVYDPLNILATPVVYPRHTAARVPPRLYGTGSVPPFAPSSLDLGGDGDHVLVLAESSLWQNDEAAAY